MIPDIPPKWVIQAARTSLNKHGNYQEYYSVLCAYYQVKFLNANINREKCKSLGENVIACYCVEVNRHVVYTKENSMSENTALHEFFHHLTHQLNLNVESKAAEILCDSFAKAVIHKGNLSEGD